jgi:hypothetical protein
MLTQPTSKPEANDRREIRRMERPKRREAICPLCGDRGGPGHLYRHLQTAHRKSEVCKHILTEKRGPGPSPEGESG